MNSRKCSIQDCGGKHLAKGYCNKHYLRWLNTGDPLTIKNVIGVGETPEEKFWSRVNKCESGCWIWQGGTTDDGYGTVNFKGRTQLAHRVAWLLTYNEFPKLQLLHSCDNPPCVNTNHLREGTNAENVEDRVRRQRSAVGQKYPQSKLTVDDVKQIIQLIGQGLSNYAIAKRFPVSHMVIKGIREGKKWKHVTGYCNA